MLPSGSIFFSTKFRGDGLNQRIFVFPDLTRLLLVVSSVCFVLSWLLPVRGLIWGSFYQECLAFLGLLVLVVLLPPKVRFSGLILCVLPLCFLPVVQVFTGGVVHGGDGWLAAFYLMSFFLAIVVGFSFDGLNVNRLVALFATACVISAGLSSFIALRQWLGYADSDWEISYFGTRPYGNLAQPNLLSTLMCFGLGSLLYLYEVRHLNRLSASMIALLVLLGLVLTQSRTASIVTLVMVVVWSFKFMGREKRLPPSYLFAWLSLFWAGSLAFPLLSELWMLPSVSFEARIASSARLDIWGAVWGMIQKSPLVGFGWGQIQQVQLLYLDSHPIQGGLLTYSHNLFLDLLLWNGWLIGCVITALMLLWAVLLFGSVRKLEHVYAVAIVGAVFVHSMVEYPHAYANFLIPAGLMLGIAERARPGRFSIAFNKWIRGGLFFASMLMLITTAQEYRYFDKNELNRRLTAAKVIGFDQVSLGREVLILSQLDAAQTFKHLDPYSKLTDDQLTFMGEVVARYPTLANMYRYVVALLTNKNVQEARRQLDALGILHGAKYHEQVLRQIAEEFGAEFRGV